MEPKSRQTDVLIVGSGPVGATFARIISENAPDAHILMVDLGPQLTPRPGMHIRNIANPQERTTAQIHSQGPTQFQYEVPSLAQRATAAQGSEESGQQKAAVLARPGTHLINPDPVDLEKSGMPAAAASTNVGGMAAHWTCACPRPGNTERILFIPDDEWDALCTKAEQLMSVTQEGFPLSIEGFAVQQALGEVFDSVLPEKRKVQPMPLAIQIKPGGDRYWVGPDVILGPLIEEANNTFELRPDTICRQLLTGGERVTGAILEHMPTGETEQIDAKIVIVAADSLRTPQLLWASGIRPTALGHYLNDHAAVMTAVSLNQDVIDRARQTLQELGKLPSESRLQGEAVIGVFWVPFHDPVHPSHGQVMHVDESPVPLGESEDRGDPQHTVILGWGSIKEIRFDNYIEFSDTETDYVGMPKMTIHYTLSDKDKEAILVARREQARAAAAFGKSLDNEEPHMMPNGTSLHYQGTIRMGENDDATSVCDPYSRVWGLDNLYVGGNGVIPTATLCNPTLTSVALAVRAAEKAAESL